MPDRKKVIERLQRVSNYFKSMLKVGYDGDAEIYREHRESVKMAIALLKELEDRHRLEVHNIGNVDIPEGVSEEHFHLVMNNVVEALQHTDKGESYPYEDTGR